MQLLRQDVEVTKDNERGAILWKTGEKGIHLIIEVTKGTGMVDHHNKELNGKGDSDSMELKCRSG